MGTCAKMRRDGHGRLVNRAQGVLVVAGLAATHGSHITSDNLPNSSALSLTEVEEHWEANEYPLLDFGGEIILQ